MERYITFTCTVSDSARMQCVHRKFFFNELARMDIAPWHGRLNGGPAYASRDGCQVRTYRGQIAVSVNAPCRYNVLHAFFVAESFADIMSSLPCVCLSVCKGVNNDWRHADDVGSNVGTV